jgi:hypothetical protein
MQELTIKNFFSDLIFHPEHAKPEDYNKSVLLTIFLTVFSVCIIPIAVGIFWAGRSFVTWIKSDKSKTDQKIEELVEKRFNEAKQKMGFEKVNNVLLAEITSLNLKLNTGETCNLVVPHPTKSETEKPKNETLAKIYHNTGSAHIIEEISIYRGEDGHYIKQRNNLSIEELLKLNWDKAYKLP